MNLFKSNWVDTIFEGRNQEYGAYVLRKQNGKYAIMALLIGSLVFTTLISVPLISKFLETEEVVENPEPLDTKTILANIEMPEKLPEEEIIEKPVEQVKEVKTIQEVVQYTEPVIVEKEKVQTEVTSVDELKNKIAGNRNIEASEDGEVVIEGQHSEVTVDSEIVEEPVDKVYTSVEVMPEYPGGLDAFRKYIANNFRSPDVDRPLKGLVVVNFVVEPNGELSNIKVVRDLGHGTGDEAIRILKRAKKWNPGIQNGRKVRVNYTLPIQIDIKNR
ncbi:MAG: energy transducer TonB [Bacteroidota bacterium]|nr:energy transducer TonB [Bacteroidota bacterium]